MPAKKPVKPSPKRAPRKPTATTKKPPVKPPAKKPPAKRAPRKPSAKPPAPTVLGATETAIKAATHLTDADRGAVQALRVLARAIDEQDERWAALAKAAAEDNKRPPAQDNVAIPTYLKYCESLGLTPAGRRLMVAPKKEEPRGKLGQLRSVPNIQRPQVS